ncbi:MAPEG family protein [Sphingomonas sp.]|uniref:MAPEG family protein n=1 Tax=Sphingomonas sp. TaxID=28214 RepID=UPI002B51DCF6|nr:MAPEG family protein [Sphingomonas sp.]HWK37168.1 MAPEG family protein [Sphingomonas sp.]
MHIFLPVALATAAAAAIVNIWLALRVGRLRISEKIMVGDGGDSRMTARMRAHANFTEYAPFVLILLALVELAAGSSPWLWGAGAVFIAGRLLHAFGMDGWRAGRMTGILTTWIVLAGLAIAAATLLFQQQARIDGAPIELAPAA